MKHKMTDNTEVKIAKLEGSVARNDERIDENRDALATKADKKDVTVLQKIIFTVITAICMAFLGALIQTII